MMRPKVFHGTYSMICANSVLPTFIPHSRFVKPGMIANAQYEIQIVDTHESLETLIIVGVAVGTSQFNRTLVIIKPKLILAPKEPSAPESLNISSRMEWFFFGSKSMKEDRSDRSKASSRKVPYTMARDRSSKTVTIFPLGIRNMQSPPTVIRRTHRPILLIIARRSSFQ